MKRIPPSFIATVIFAVVLGLAAPALARDLQGTVQAWDPAKRELKVQADGKVETFTLAPSTPVVLDGKQAALKDIQKGSAIKLSLEEKGGRATVTKVELGASKATQPKRIGCW